MIPIQNIYYMLSYAFQVLQEQGYRSVAAENFQNTADLCAAILEKGVSSQLKRGLGREYREKTEPLASPRGKLDLTASIKDQTIRNKQLVCTYDEFSVDTEMNRILKATCACCCVRMFPVNGKRSCESCYSTLEMSAKCG